MAISTDQSSVRRGDRPRDRDIGLWPGFGEERSQVGCRDRYLQAVDTVDRDHRDAVAVAQEQIIAGADIDAFVSVRSDHLVEQNARLVTEVAPVTFVEDDAAHWWTDDRGAVSTDSLGMPRRMSSDADMRPVKLAAGR
jgi:hypothetical protein